MTIDDAKAFIRYNIKEGVYEAEQFEGMTDEELIKFAENETDRGEAYYESQKED